jgi:hypothetical protein
VARKTGFSAPGSGAFELVLSPPILEELARALFYEKLRRFRWMTDAEIRDLLQALAAVAS